MEEGTIHTREYCPFCLEGGKSNEISNFEKSMSHDEIITYDVTSIGIQTLRGL